MLNFYRKERIRIIIIKIIIRNGAKTISLQTLFGRLNKKQSKNNKSPNVVLGDLNNSHDLLRATWTCPQQISETTAQNFMKLGGVIDICF
jgi:hypothetical protein